MLASLFLAAPLPVIGSELETTQCFVIDGERAVIARTADGLLRRVTIDGLEATAESRDHVGRRAVWMEEVAGGRFVVYERGRSVTLRSCATLEALGEVLLPPLEKSVEADPTGRHVASVSGKTKIVLGAFGAADAEPRSLDLEARVMDLAFRRDGKQLAALTEVALHVFDLTPEAGPERMARVMLGAGEFGREVAFAPGGKIAVGLHTQDVPVQPAPSVRLIDPERGDAVLEFVPPASLAPLGGWVSSLEHHEASGLITFGLTSAGSVVAFDPGSGELRWSIEFGGGNPGGIGVQRPPGSRRGFTHGMTSRHRAVIDWESGRVESYEALVGIDSLDAPAGDDVIVGVREGALVVLDGETFEERARRREPLELPAPEKGR